jgi:hypothetical protein
MRLETARDLFRTARNPKMGKPLDKKNTRLFKPHPNKEYYEIRLHGNTIITITPTSYILDACGWRSVTTKQRLNHYTPFTIFQKNFTWYVDWGFDPVLHVTEFYDGMEMGVIE